MRQSLDQFEVAFEREAAIEEAPRGAAQRAANRSRARASSRTEQRGRVRFSVLVVALTATVVTVVVVMFEVLAWLVAAERREPALRPRSLELVERLVDALSRGSSPAGTFRLGPDRDVDLLAEDRMSRGASIPMPHLVAGDGRTEISISSPIMMLWLVFRVRTSIARSPEVGGRGVPGPWRVNPGSRSHSGPPPTPVAREVRSNRALAGQSLGTPGSATRHGRKAPPLTAEPDPRLGARGSHRRLDRPSARDLRLGAARVPPPPRPPARRRARRSTSATRSRPRSRPTLAARRSRGGRERRGGRGRGGRREEDEARRRTPRADDERPRRRRRRRGGRGRRRGGATLEGSFDHGEEDGYGLWLDPEIKDNPVYAEHWAGHRPVGVTVEADQIVIRRPATTTERPWAPRRVLDPAGEPRAARETRCGWPGPPASAPGPARFRRRLALPGVSGTLARCRRGLERVQVGRVRAVVDQAALVACAPRSARRRTGTRRSARRLLPRGRPCGSRRRRSRPRLGAAEPSRRRALVGPPSRRRSPSPSEARRAARRAARRRSPAAAPRARAARAPRAPARRRSRSPRPRRPTRPSCASGGRWLPGITRRQEQRQRTTSNSAATIASTTQLRGLGQAA